MTSVGTSWSRRSPWLGGLAVLLVASQAQGQSGGGATPAPPPPCTAPEFRQFDFWIGTWEVRDSSGSTILGTNRIESILNGCALQENWSSTGPAQTGRSFNKYFPPRKMWHQTWIDDTGGFLLLDGEFNDGKMTLRGSMPQRDGAVVQHRITWSRVKTNPARVRQYWESSTDGGTTWSTAFDGIYWRKR